MGQPINGILTPPSRWQTANHRTFGCPLDGFLWLFPRRFQSMFQGEEGLVSWGARAEVLPKTSGTDWGFLRRAIAAMLNTIRQNIKTW